MIKEVTRHISSSVRLELWARAAGRCEFSGCNRLVYKSPVTQESVNISEKAHIYSFSKDGPRGRGPFANKPAGLNQVSNLLLVCHDCHREIDKRKDGGRYPASLLSKWKREHEHRIRIVTGVNPSKKSHVVLYGANIGDEESPLQPELAKWSLFPNRYPAEETPITIAMTWEGRDDEPDYWRTEEANLVRAFERLVRPLITDGCHFSVFGFAPMPLLIRLGTLFTDKIAVQVYQLRREPEQTWRWGRSTKETPYVIHKPSVASGRPVLVISLSDRVAPGRVTSVLGSDVSIWELTIREPHNDFLRVPEQLSEFRRICRRMMGLISERHGLTTPLAVFPAMPVACSVELGRIRMPKAAMPWTVYDQNSKRGTFVQALTIGG